MASIAPQLIPIEVDTDTKRIRVLTNIIKMLTNRELLDPKELDKNIENIKKIKSDDLVYKIDLQNTDKNKDKDKETSSYIIKKFNQQISAINKSSGVSDFLNKYKNYHKILVVNSITNKPAQYIYSHYPETEIFLEHDLMMDIASHVSVPKHMVLSDEESSEIIKAYNVKQARLPSMLITDKMARYFNMKTGQICKILRPSETAGIEPYYRRVVGSLTSKN